jgi:NAD(P)H-hydrate repair Nnr-like enzyme with NAD(P)H-hydrate epimerase domain
MEVLTTAEMDRADRLTIAAGTPGFALMLSAGQGVAGAAADLVEEGPIIVVCGPGNNGGDGFVAAMRCTGMRPQPRGGGNIRSSRSTPRRSAGRRSSSTRCSVQD